MATLGYARVSTDTQTTDPQTGALAAAGCERIFTDNASGATLRRPQLAALLDYAREGDLIVVTALDRLSRSLSDLVQLVGMFDQRGLQFRSLRENVDTSQPGGRLMMHMAGAFAEFEREVLRERTLVGLEAARRRGAQIGRPSVFTPDRLEQIRELTDRGKSRRQIAELLRISESSVTRGRQIVTAAAVDGD